MAKIVKMVNKTFEQLQKGDSMYIVNLYGETREGMEIEVPKALEVIVEDVYTDGGYVFVSYRRYLDDMIDDGDNLSISQEMLALNTDQYGTSDGFYCTTKAIAQAYIASYIAELTEAVMKELEYIQKKMNAYTSLAFNPTNYFLKIGKSYES